MRKYTILCIIFMFFSLNGMAQTWINVHSYGATGDGTTDDTYAIRDAITAAPAGATLFFPRTDDYYKIDEPITISKALIIRGEGIKSQIRQDAANTLMFVVGASDVKFYDLKLCGPQYGTQHGNEIAIYINYGGDYQNYLTNIRIENCKIENFGFAGIWMKFTENFAVTNCEINNVYYAGFLCSSSGNGYVNNNCINNIIGTPNAYGIALTRDENDSLTLSPRSYNITVTGNIVNNVTSWEGIDTHGGENILIDNNQIYNCLVGIVIGGSDNVSQQATFAPLNCMVVNNIIDSKVTDGSKRSGIAFCGASYTGDRATGVITNNIIKGHGDEDYVNSAAISCAVTEGVVVSNNTIIVGAPYGIDFRYANYDFLCVGNNIIDAWSDSVNSVSGIIVSYNNNIGHINSNYFSRSIKSATYVMVYGINIVDYANNSIQIGFNYSETTTYISDPGSHCKDLILQPTTGKIGIGISPSFKLDVQEENADVNQASTILNLRHKAIGTAQDGFGAAIRFYGENDAGAIANIAVISAIFTDVSSGAEKGVITFTPRSGGNFHEKMRLDHLGRLGISTTAPTALLDVNSNIIRLRTAKTPTSAGDIGNPGDICWDENYIYICVAANTWKRAELSW